MNDIVNALVALLVITLICAVGIIIVGSFMMDAIIQKIEGNRKATREKLCAYKGANNGVD